LAVGMPSGMVFGKVIGTSMDKNVFDEGRQLDLENKY